MFKKQAYRTIFFDIQTDPNYIRDVQGGTVAPSSSSKLTGIAVQ
ncbi:lysis protein for colicin E6 [Salmonella enterica subsp. enterica]|nr:lysis protein for colicin E6 [Salmonella enterica subsp. enterica]